MKVARMIVVGCGGIGSHYIPNVVRMFGVTRPECLLVDGDAYTTKNAGRQFLATRHNGSMKAEAMSRFLMDYYGWGTKKKTTYIHDDEEFAGMVVKDQVRMRELHGDDSIVLVALCVDNDATRRICYDGIRMSKANVIVVDMANERTHGDVIVWGWVDGQDVGPFPPKMYPNIANPSDRPPGAYCSQQVELPGGEQLITTNMMAACLGLEITRRILNDEPLCPQYMFNLSPKQGESKMMWSM